MKKAELIICGMHLLSQMLVILHVLELKHKIWLSEITLCDYVGLYSLFTSIVITSYSSYWISLRLLCTSAPVVLCYDWFNRVSGQIKCDPVNLVMEDFHINLCWGIVVNWSPFLISCTMLKNANLSYI